MKLINWLILLITLTSCHDRNKVFEISVGKDVDLSQSQFWKAKDSTSILELGNVPTEVEYFGFKIENLNKRKFKNIQIQYWVGLGDDSEQHGLVVLDRFGEEIIDSLCFNTDELIMERLYYEVGERDIVVVFREMIGSANYPNPKFATRWYGIDELGAIEMFRRRDDFRQTFVRLSMQNDHCGKYTGNNGKYHASIELRDGKTRNSYSMQMLASEENGCTIEMKDWDVEVNDDLMRLDLLNNQLIDIVFTNDLVVAHLKHVNVCDSVVTTKFEMKM